MYRMPTTPEVWIDSRRCDGRVSMAPCLRAERPMQIGYNVTLARSGRSGNLCVSHHGTAALLAGETHKLCQLAFDALRVDEVWVEVALDLGDQNISVHSFDCPG